MRKGIYLGALGLCLVGCASTPANQTLPEFNTYLGASWAYVDFCLEEQAYTQEFADSFYKEVGRLYSVFLIDNSVVLKTKSDVAQILRNGEDSVNEACLSSLPVLQAAIWQWRGEVDQYARRQASIDRANQTRQPRQRTTTQQPTYQPIQVPMPSGDVTFGMPGQQSTRHRLENGQIRSCTSTSTGVDICR